MNMNMNLVVVLYIHTYGLLLMPCLGSGHPGESMSQPLLASMVLM